MSNPKLAYIVGNPATGKGTLRGLLDGHPLLAVSPIQHMLIEAFIDYPMDDEITDPVHPEVFDIIGFRENLARTGYYKLQANQVGSPRTATTISLQHSTDEKHNPLIGFDFYEFERDWAQKINELDLLSPENVFLTIYRTFFEQWESYDIDWRECDYVVGTGINKRRTVDYLLKNYEGSKVIVVDRDPRGIIAARGKGSSNRIDELLSSGKMYQLLEYMAYIRKMQKQYDDRVLVVNFRDLILEHERVMEKVIEFLGIEWNDALDRSTLAGERLYADSEESSLGQINDDWRDLLNDRERRIAGLQMGEEQLTNCTSEEIWTYLRSIPEYRLSPYLRLAKRGIEEFRSI